MRQRYCRRLRRACRSLGLKKRYIALRASRREPWPSDGACVVRPARRWVLAVCESRLALSQGLWRHDQEFQSHRLGLTNEWSGQLRPEALGAARKQS